MKTRFVQCFGFQRSDLTPDAKSTPQRTSLCVGYSSGRDHYEQQEVTMTKILRTGFFPLPSLCRLAIHFLNLHILLFKKIFLAAPHGMWHLSSPPTTPPALEGGVLITRPPGKSPDWAFVPCIFLIDNIHSLSKHFLSRIYRREWKSQYNR